MKMQSAATILEDNQTSDNLLDKQKGTLETGSSFNLVVICAVSTGRSNLSNLTQNCAHFRQIIYTVIDIFKCERVIFGSEVSSIVYGKLLYLAGGTLSNKFIETVEDAGWLTNNTPGVYDLFNYPPHDIGLRLNSVTNSSWVIIKQLETIIYRLKS